MKYIHKFNTDTQFNEVYNGAGYTEPWVSYTEDVTRVDYNKPDPSNGHDYVDLGLPSGTLWATMNIGATKPEEYGDYFAWGETEPKDIYAWSTYKYGNVYNALTKYCNNSSYGKDGFTDSLTELELADDAARVNWGGEWRMPTSGQVQELIDNTTSAWTNNYNNTGVSGMTFTSKTNGNTMFVPAAGTKDAGVSGVSPTEPSAVGSQGILLCRSLYSTEPAAAWSLNSNKIYGNPTIVGNEPRRCGDSIRGVINPNE